MSAINIYRLKDVMKEKGISGKVLAEKVGVSANFISNISAKGSHPKPELIVKIAEALDVDLRELFISTKGVSLSDNEVSAAKELIRQGLNILEGKQPEQVESN